jgi:hypothetical protein
MKALPLIALPSALLVALVVVSVGQHFTSDWPTIWFALTAIAASLTLAAATAAALYAKAQIDTARTFQQINLTTQLVTTYTPFIFEFTSRVNNVGTWTAARDITTFAIQTGDAESIKAQQDVINVVSEFGDLYVSGALHPDLLFRRTDYSICLAWFMFENVFYSWGAVNVVLLDSIKRLVKDAYAFLKTSRPTYAQSIPELRDFRI